MEARSSEPPFQRLSTQELMTHIVQLISTLQATYEPGRDRIITPENVFQTGREKGRDALESFMDVLLAPGSALLGAENLERCLEALAAGRSVLFLSEHRGNLDVPSFAVLLRRGFPRAEEIARRLIYIAGRKLNESSDLVKMFTEKYSRLVIVPRRDFPLERPDASEQERREREEFVQYAARINRAAFRELVRLKKSGRIFVLFPLGGRIKPDADNRPVRESTSYVRSFDTAFLVSMEGNTLPPLARMEEERPVQARVVFRVGPPLDCKAFLAAERRRIAEAQRAGRLPADADPDQVVVEHIMAMLEHLRLHGSYGPHTDL
jgi:1-acyl-sn-glycerol-3-phosphate acyltransferase